MCYRGIPHDHYRDLQVVVILISHRVIEEIEEVVGDKPSVEVDDLDKLTYMNQVLHVKNSVKIYENRGFSVDQLKVKQLLPTFR